MKLMKTEDAVGQVLCHDITQIIKGVTKDAVFRKGHIITEEDIPVLLSVGKDNIYIWEKDDTMLHENEAAQILYDMCKNDHMHPSDVKEGKIELIADCDGLLKVDREKLKKVNSLGEMMIATRHGDTYVKKGDKLAGTRIIPLVIKKEKMETAQAVCSDGPILTLKPFHKKKFAVLTTGNEVYYHRIEDTFTPVIQEKLAEFGAEMIFHEVYDDDASKITDGCRRAMEAGADLVFCTGGMSVDPDDKTPLAIKNTGARIVSYGAPVLPGGDSGGTGRSWRGRSLPELQGLHLPELRFWKRQINDEGSVWQNDRLPADFHHGRVQFEMPVLYAGECGGLCTGAGGTESAAYRRRDAEDCARRGWAWHHALPDYRRGTAGKKRVRGAGAENKSSAGHRIRWDHDEWRTPGIVCEGSEGGRL